jgi:hypothetical protein
MKTANTANTAGETANQWLDHKNEHVIGSGTWVAIQR